MNLYECSLTEYLKYRGLYFYHIEELEKFFTPNDNPYKNFDLLVPGDNQNLLIEIKGRKASGKSKMRFENWVTGDDIQSLMYWEKKFGQRFKGVFCFVYKIEPDLPPANTECTAFTFNNLRFAFLGIELSRYITESTLRSVKWNTFSLPSKVFVKYAKPIEHFLSAKNSELEFREIEQTFAD